MFKREDEQKLVGRRIKQLRENQGYTQADLAHRLGVAEKEVRKIEEGKFSLDLFHLLARLLDILERSILKQWADHREGLLR
jgi:transcriptional regulator with XRE-family HTH domain